MTSDFIAQYVKEKTGWKQENLFQYEQKEGDFVEGMGFGAFHHFWITGPNDAYGALYEVGGGDLQQYVEPS